MRKGFTLIELLVVIAIIAILAAILFPVFMNARENAFTTKCISHGKELGTAALMYMDDNGGKFPTIYNKYALYAMGFKDLPPYDWPYDQDGPVSKDPEHSQLRLLQLRKYVKNDEIWLCPDPAPYTLRYVKMFRCSWLPRSADDFVDGDRGFCDGNGQAFELGGMKFAGRTVFEVLSLDAKGETKCGPRYLTPSKKIMFMCYAFGIEGHRIINPGTWRQDTFPSYPHGDGSVFVYADGHAQQRKMGKGWAPVGYTNLPIDQAP